MVMSGIKFLASDRSVHPPSFLSTSKKTAKRLSRSSLSDHYTMGTARDQPSVVQVESVSRSQVSKPLSGDAHSRVRILKGPNIESCSPSPKHSHTPEKRPP